MITLHNLHNILFFLEYHFFSFFKFNFLCIINSLPVIHLFFLNAQINQIFYQFLSFFFCGHISRIAVWFALIWTDFPVSNCVMVSPFTITMGIPCDSLVSRSAIFWISPLLLYRFIPSFWWRHPLNNYLRMYTWVTFLKFYKFENIYILKFDKLLICLTIKF